MHICDGRGRVETIPKIAPSRGSSGDLLYRLRVNLCGLSYWEAGCLLHRIRPSITASKCAKTFAYWESGHPVHVDLRDLCDDPVWRKCAARVHAAPVGACLGPWIRWNAWREVPYEHDTAAQTALDAVGGYTQQEIAILFGVTRERIRQMEILAAERVRNEIG